MVRALFFLKLSLSWLCSKVRTYVRLRMMKGVSGSPCNSSTQFIELFRAVHGVNHSRSCSLVQSASARFISRPHRQFRSERIIISDLYCIHDSRTPHRPRYPLGVWCLSAIWAHHSQQPQSPLIIQSQNLKLRILSNGGCMDV